MLKNKIKIVVVLLVALTTTCGSSLYAARSYSSDVLVVPSRFTIIQLAFDVAALRDVSLIAYESSNGDEEPVLHVWNKTSSSWENLTIDEYSIGSFLATTPREMILIGSDKDLPASLISGASQAKRVTRIDSLNVAPVINELNKSMKFSQQEWKVLAERHGLQIKDRNEERRRWGRYGDPNKKKVKKVSEEELASPKACESSFKDGFEALDAEFNDIEETESPKLDLPPEDEPVAEFDEPKVAEVYLLLDDEPEQETPVVIIERLVIEMEPVAEEDRLDSPEDK